MVRQKLLDHGFDAPGLTTLQGWMRRDSIPGDWAVATLMLAQREGFLPDLSKMLREPEA